MLRKPTIAANLKMHDLPAGWDSSTSPYQPHPDVDVIVFPNFLDIESCVAAELSVGAQCGYPESKEPQTGDISVPMLKERGVAYVLCGHSERRLHHGETSDMVATMTKEALAEGLIPLVCLGETKEEKDNGNTEQVLAKQMEPLPKDKTYLLAYEPRWAIGAGVIPTKEEIEHAHGFIRKQMGNPGFAIFYGGSADDTNAADILRVPGVDGLLVGGACLKLEKVGKMVKAAAKMIA